MKTITLTTKGHSLKEIIKIYGIGSDGFFSQDWYENEKFFTDKPEAGTYELYFDKSLINKTFEKQVGKLKKDFSPTHPALIAEAVLSHFKKTGERLLEDWYVRSDTLGSVGNRVNVGGFGAWGLSVVNWYDDCRDGRLGLSAVRKLPLNTKTSDTPGGAGGGAFRDMVEHFTLSAPCPHCGELIRIKLTK